MLKINIYAVNIKGRSESTLLESYTLKAAEKQTGKFLKLKLTQQNQHEIHVITLQK